MQKKVMVASDQWSFQYNEVEFDECSLGLDTLPTVSVSVFRRTDWASFENDS